MAEVPVNFAVRDTPGGPSRRADERLSGAARNGSRYRVRHQTVADSVWRVSSAAVWVAGREHALLAAINEATAEVKYFLTNATEAPIRVAVAVAFRRWRVEHGFRLAKQEAGLMDDEGRSYLGLVRHLTLSLIVLGFVAGHTERLRGKNPLVTPEQVCRALNHGCATRFRRRRDVPEIRHTSRVIRYHQRRNEQAARSHKKRRHRCII